MNIHYHARSLGISILLALLIMASNSIAGLHAAEVNPLLPKGYQEDLDQDGIMRQAEKYYVDNDLQKALQGYQYLHKLGIRNGYLFYNLGNTYLRLGHIGPAMLWYERALRYLPRHGDLRINYNYARNQLVDEEFQQPGYGGTIDFMLGIHHYLNLRESIICMLICFWLLSISIVTQWFIRSEKLKAWFKIPCWILLVAFILFFLSSAFKIWQYESRSEAIVMESAVDVKTGPSEELETAFTLHEGTKIRIIHRQSEWFRIELPGHAALNGWMPKNTVERI